MRGPPPLVARGLAWSVCVSVLCSRGGWAQAAESREPAVTGDAPASSRAEDAQKAVVSRDEDPRARVHPRGHLLSSWSITRQRWFVSARADLGYLFFRPRVSVGYGIPHISWVGADLVPIFSGGQAGLYGGLRYRHPRFELRSGMLYTAAFFRGYLAPAEHFDERDLSTRTGAAATSVAWDSEMTLSQPLGPGYLRSETQALMLLGLASDDWIYVETLGIIAAPSWSAREQLRYTLPLPWVEGLFVGVAAEAVLSPGREQPWVIRGGAVVRFWMYQDLELRTDVMPTLVSPDNLGRSGSPWLTISARFLWATP